MLTIQAWLEYLAGGEESRSDELRVDCCAPPARLCCVASPVTACHVLSM